MDTRLTRVALVVIVMGSFLVGAASSSGAAPASTAASSPTATGSVPYQFECSRSTWRCRVLNGPVVYPNIPKRCVRATYATIWGGYPKSSVPGCW